MAQRKTAEYPKERRSAGKHLAAAPAGRRPARPIHTRKATEAVASGVGSVNSKALYQHFVPYIEEAHHRNERSLKAGVWLLVLLPIVLIFIQKLTNASKIVFLIVWIFGMFGIATALIFTAYSDHDLKKTLTELKEIVPPEEDFEIGNLLPVDAEGEGWLIDPEELPIPLPDLAEKLPQMSEELKGRIADREAARQQELAQRREVRQQRREGRTRRTVPEPEVQSADVGKHEKQTSEETRASAPRHLAEPEPATESGTADHERTSGRMQLDNQFLNNIGKKHRKPEK